MDVGTDVIDPDRKIQVCPVSLREKIYVCIYDPTDLTVFLTLILLPETLRVRVRVPPTGPDSRDNRNPRSSEDTGRFFKKKAEFDDFNQR